tara:strand:- start:199 stop:552 length:354 start_codon:yes stop_codon:yes gene_type:complete
VYTYNGTITAVYDGDTLTCDMDLGFNMWAKKAKLRLYGLNTPEIRGGTALTKQAGYAARDFVRELVLGKTVRVHSVGKGKYGRYLATVWPIEDGQVREESLNDELVRLGMAEVYMRD